MVGMDDFAKPVTNWRRIALIVAAAVAVLAFAFVQVWNTAYNHGFNDGGRFSYKIGVCVGRVGQMQDDSTPDHPDLGTDVDLAKIRLLHPNEC